MMKTAFRWIRWAAFNGGHITLLWLGLFHGVAGARHLGIFMCWLLFFLSLFFLNDQVREAVRKKPPIATLGMNALVDLIIVGLLVWQGWFITGAAFVLHIMFWMRLYEKPGEATERAPVVQ